MRRRSVTSSVAAAASTRWFGRAGCNGTTTGGRRNGAKGWALRPDVLPVFKSQEDWEGGANAWRGAGGPIHIRRPKDPHPTAPAFLDAARAMGMPVPDDVNGPMRPRRRLHQHEHRRGWDPGERRSRLPAPRVVEAEPDAACSRRRCVKLNFQGHSLRRRQGRTDGAVNDIAGRQGSHPGRRRHQQPEAAHALGRRGSEGTAPLSASTSSRICPGSARICRTMCSCPVSSSSTRAKCRDRPADSNAVEAEAYLSSAPSGRYRHQSHARTTPIVTPETAARFGAPPSRRVHDCSGAGAANEPRVCSPGQQELRGCRGDRWQLSRHVRSAHGRQWQSADAGAPL